MSNVTVHVTGGIAVYKVLELVRQFQKNGDVVHVAMTQNATHFVTPTTFAALTKFPVLTDLFAAGNQNHIAHIELADWTELAVVVPATADVIAKLANGIADDAVSTTLLATSAPKVIVPAMNNHMWSNPAVQRNVKLLQADGSTIMDPATGRLAEGYSGKGRMPEVTEIFDFITRQFQNNQLAGKQLVITAGGTRESLDPVRFIGNRSSGKMGIALAVAAANAGAQVKLIVGQVTAPLPNHPQISIRQIESTEQLSEAVTAEFSSADVLIMAAAVADFTPVEVADQKIKKTSDNDELVLHLKKTPDILKQIGSTKQNQFVVGFAAETQNLLANGQKKLADKHADLIIANQVSAHGLGFGSDDNQVTILARDSEPIKWDKMTKTALAQQLITLIAAKI